MVGLKSLETFIKFGLVGTNKQSPDFPTNNFDNKRGNFDYHNLGTHPFIIQCLIYYANYNCHWHILVSTWTNDTCPFVTQLTVYMKFRMEALFIITAHYIGGSCVSHKHIILTRNSRKEGTLECKLY